MSLLENYFSQTKKNSQKSSAIAYLAALDHIAATAPHVVESIVQELKDERSHLKLIASENFSSLAVQLAMGNLLTDKYAEGYPEHRFYAGCENVDSVEMQAANLLKKIFSADHAYVQPHSGADANMVAYWTILVHKFQNRELEKLGKKSIDELTPQEYEQIRQLMLNQKMMGMGLNSGGHLTHGFRHNLSSKMMQAVSYEVDPQTEMLDYTALAKQVKEEKPAILVAGYSAYPRKINFAKMKEIADSVGAVFLVDMAHFSGLVAGKAFQGEYDPVPYADIVTSTTHKTLRGPRGGFILCKLEYADAINKGCPLVLGGPLPHVIAAKAVAFNEADTPEFQSYSRQIIANAQTLSEELMKKGLRITTGGTENHLLIVDVSKLGLTGRQAETVLRKAGITLNRNAIPNDKNGAWYTSGIRLGTPALTTLGMKTGEMKEIADLIYKILHHTQPAIVEKTGLPSKSQTNISPEIIQESKQRVHDLLSRFPLYPEILV